MTGIVTYIWHRGKSNFDEVRWDPRLKSIDEATAAARNLLAEDSKATRIVLQQNDATIAQIDR